MIRELKKLKQHLSASRRSDSWPLGCISHCLHLSNRLGLTVNERPSAAEEVRRPTVSNPEVEKSLTSKRQDRYDSRLNREADATDVLLGPTINLVVRW